MLGRGLRAACYTLLLVGAARADEAADFFRQSCFSCHTIGGGRLTGPDLKDVTTRREKAWLTAFILNPKGVIDGGDAYANELVQQARGVVMPTVAGINAARSAALVDLIEAESKLPESQFKGLSISSAPFTADEIAQGAALFKGARALKNGAPACVSCHSAGPQRGLGGGRLAPDLTKVFERMQSRAALAGWLQGPATPVMGSLLKPRPLDRAEILPLVAFFESTAQVAAPADTVPLLRFLVLGLLGTVGALLLLDSIWRRRFRAVRRPLLAAARR
ncbi:MAG: c-type cytochrome [Fimbriimonadaceae bacterium]|nr:c-type cytochrome [Fimbriimonadaceae bacterium]